MSVLQPAHPLVDTPASTAGAQDLLSIQYLRGLAALMVVFFHALQFPGFVAAVPTTVGIAGVDIFFVISGFVMTIVTSAKAYTPIQFLTRRIARVVPLYWFYTSLTAAILLTAPSVFRTSVFTLNHFILSLLFIPNENPGEPGSLAPMVKIGWTLDFEMLFYVVFSLFLASPRLHRIIYLSGLFFVLWASNHLLDLNFAFVRFWGNPILYEFIFGCLVGHLYLQGQLRAFYARTSWAAIIAALLLLNIFGLVEHGTYRAFVFGIPAAVLVAAFICLEISGALPASRIGKFLGDASYSIYLSHLFSIVAFRTFWTIYGLPTEGTEWALIFIAGSLFLSVTGGALSYVLLERPLLRILRPGRIA
jgi:exopolysaccharide production protein ExoZ